MAEMYKQKIKELLDRITNVKFLEYLYIMVQEFVSEE